MLLCSVAALSPVGLTPTGFFPFCAVVIASAGSLACWEGRQSGLTLPLTLILSLMLSTLILIDLKFYIC